MKTLIASLVAPSLVICGLMAAPASAAQVGVRIGPVGIEAGHWHHHHHWYRHRHWERDHWRYW
jgi:hypothetical protein